MKQMSMQWWALLLTIVGAVNWGLVGLLGFDLVEYIATLVNVPIVGTIVYVLVGVAGVVLIPMLGMKK